MKNICLLFIGLIIISGTAFSQCPQRGVKVIGADCNPPKDLAAALLSCSSLSLKWKGNSNQSFILNSGYTKGTKDSVIEIESVKVTADNSGDCIATIPVEEGITVKWNVQAICSKDSINLYSTKTNGPDTYIHPCGGEANITKENGLCVYPNPASKYLMVVLNEKITGNIEFKIFDINGKKVYDKSGNAVTKMNNEYKLDLPNLASGTYLIEIHHEGKADKTKFVLIRK